MVPIAYVGCVVEGLDWLFERWWPPQSITRALVELAAASFLMAPLLARGYRILRSYMK
jgi:hypothetical protein